MMKNGLDDVEGCVASPPSKRIKVEIRYVHISSLVKVNKRYLLSLTTSVDDDAHLLSTASENMHDRKPGPRRKRLKLRSTTEDRALVLLNDPRISAVEPTQVLCRMCGHWIQLFKHIEFSPANWRTHADKCEVRTG